VAAQLHRSRTTEPPAVRHDPLRGMLLLTSSSANAKQKTLFAPAQALHCAIERSAVCLYSKEEYMNATFANTKAVTEFASSISRAKRIAARIIVTAMALVALTALPHVAEAQSAATGKFTLAAPAKLGTVWLPTGDYTYKVQWTSSLPLLAVSKTDSTVNEFVFPAAIKQINKPADNKLTLAVANGETYISSITLSELGLKLVYAEPKTFVAKHYAVPGAALASNVQPAK
jgi:hypothetical protein